MGIRRLLMWSAFSIGIAVISIGISNENHLLVCISQGLFLFFPFSLRFNQWSKDKLVGSVLSFLFSLAGILVLYYLQILYFLLFWLVFNSCAFYPSSLIIRHFLIVTRTYLFGLYCTTILFTFIFLLVESISDENLFPYSFFPLLLNSLILSTIFYKTTSKELFEIGSFNFGIAGTVSIYIIFKLWLVSIWPPLVFSIFFIVCNGWFFSELIKKLL